MKKTITFFCSICVLLLISSCETTNVYPATSKTFVYVINPNQWTDNKYQIFHTINLPELTTYYVKQGHVGVALSFDNEVSYDVLPATFDGVAYSVRYSAGRLTLYGEDPLADRNILVPIPGQVKVKIVLTESDYID